MAADIRSNSLTCIINKPSKIGSSQDQEESNSSQTLTTSIQGAKTEQISPKVKPF